MKSTSSKQFSAKRTRKSFVGTRIISRPIRMRNELAAALVTARLSKGLTQAQVARSLGLSQASIAILENGRGDLQFSTILKLCRVLGLEVSVGPKPEGHELNFAEDFSA